MKKKFKTKKTFRRNADRHPRNIVTRATNATRVRPEDNSKYVTTLTKPTKGKYEVGIRVSDFAVLYRVVTRKKLTSRVDKKLTSKKRGKKIDGIEVKS